MNNGIQMPNIELPSVFDISSTEELHLFQEHETLKSLDNLVQLQQHNFVNKILRISTSLQSLVRTEYVGIIDYTT